MNVILHIFSNSIRDHLITLAKEKEALLAILRQRESTGEYQYIQLEEESLDKIEAVLRQYEKNLIALQYSGHAGEQSLLVRDLEVNSEGIALQLKDSAQKYVLKLVVLNGCCTGGLAEKLIAYGVPAVISTSSPVFDESATIFSIHFWRNLITYNLNIERSFWKAIGPAQTRTRVQLDPSVWKLWGEKDAIRINPIHFIEAQSIRDDFTPNGILFPALYREYLRVGNEHVTHSRDGTKGERMAAMLNSIPHPMSSHLQKLFSPLEASPEKYDQVSIKRLEQIGQLYQNTSEFCFYIMVAQLWEIMLEFPSVKCEISPAIRELLWSFLSMKTEPRETFDFIPMMKTLLNTIKDLNENDQYKAFIDKQIIYKDFLRLPDEFYAACAYLMPLRIHTYEEVITEINLQFLCKDAEQHLLQFLKPLSFMHRYKLTSIQNINVIKLRHTKHAYTRYKHKMTFLMNAKGGEESSFYYMKSYIDTWSVILIKDEKRRKAQTIEEPTFVTMFVDFLNLSPFVIDQNIYSKNTTLSDIMFFRGFFPEAIGYKRVSNTLDKKDIQVLPIEDNISPLTKQFKNFKKIVLGNRP
ncbi:MAG: hypothetical protein J0H74_14745 [Chitinophagaceae bacterium]|nr:hypothetical protein [Chitinophagaceae bacterium]